MKDKKKIVIGTLCALIMIMAVGYALLSQQLSINGSASITSNWQVEITNITEKEKSTGATTNNTNYTATTASFNTSLTSPGDYAIYEVTVTNKGTLDAVLAAKPTVTTGNNEAIQYELEGIKKGDKILKNNQTDTFTIKVQYNSSTTTQPNNLTSNIEVTLNYEQDLGQVSSYDTYSIGDKITFAGSDWYVIKNSSDKEDYVTLLKERVLTKSELGNYSIGMICSSTDVMSNNNGCTEIGQQIRYDKMAYYWSNICNYYKLYGTDVYNGEERSGCEGHNNYSESKIKVFLEESYVNTLEANKLKEVDGYKIRLITKEELEGTLGYEKRIGTDVYDYNSENTPDWIYQNYHVNDSFYWTMTPSSNSSRNVYTLDRGGLSGYSNIEMGATVRPVINLYKSAIE